MSTLTHDVLNQSVPFEDVNLFDSDLALREALEREGAEWALDRVRDVGVVAGSAEAQEHGRRAERNEPRLRTHDRFGHRLDEVELDPSWHWLLRGAVEREIHSLPWRDPRPGAHVARAALELLWTHANAGVICPVSMTYSAIPALRRDPELAAEWEPRLTLPDYERGALCGMAMTEKQGGSDVRANTTRAEPAGDGWFELTGHKWFCSYPPCAVFLVLAQAPAGLSCFVLERGPGMEFQRLKDKLGTRSLPSSEVEFRAAPARLLGEEGRGVATIIEMVTHTRLDCVIGSAAGMRRGVAEAVHHARHRSAFGSRLAEKPAMVNVLADRRSSPRPPPPPRSGSPAPTTRRTTRCAASPPRSSSTGSASAPPRTRPRRSSAWAATATWRSPRCRACCATRRSTASGRARAT
jgi:putative acyl-CoA dehydrogenase